MEGTLVFNVLLLLTDGEIHDMDVTKKLIVQASQYPCSIIIVGVGNEDFELMEELDSDGKILTDADGNRAHRDVV